MELSVTTCFVCKRELESTFIEKHIPMCYRSLSKKFDQWEKEIVQSTLDELCDPDKELKKKVFVDFPVNPEGTKSRKIEELNFEDIPDDSW